MRRVVLAAVALIALSSCKVDLTVGIDARGDGGGEIRVTATLDREAAEEVGDLKEKLRTDDLEAAGWVIDAPEELDDGRVAQTIRHAYRSPEEAEQVFAHLAGDAADSPFRNFDLEQERGFFKTTTSFSGTVDLQRGVEAFSDEQLRATLGGQPLGVPVEQLEQRLGTTLDRIFGLQVALRMPGRVDANAPTITDNGAVWSPTLGEQVELRADASRWNVANIALLVIAISATIGLLAVLVTRRRPRVLP